MNVQLLPAALEDIAVLRGTGYRGAGFLLGSVMGRFVLVGRLLPLDFDPRGSGDALAVAFAKYGERLQGAFFCRRPPCAMDGLIGDLVLAIRAAEVQAFTCRFTAGKRKARLEPLLEEAEAGEGQWPS